MIDAEQYELFELLDLRPGVATMDECKQRIRDLVEIEEGFESLAEEVEASLSALRKHEGNDEIHLQSSVEELISENDDRRRDSDTFERERDLFQHDAHAMKRALGLDHGCALETAVSTARKGREAIAHRETLLEQLSDACDDLLDYAYVGVQVHAKCRNCEAEAMGDSADKAEDNLQHARHCPVTKLREVLEAAGVKR